MGKRQIDAGVRIVQLIRHDLPRSCIAVHVSSVEDTLDILIAEFANNSNQQQDMMRRIQRVEQLVTDQARLIENG